MSTQTAPRKTLGERLAQLVEATDISPEAWAVIRESVAELESAGVAPGLAIGARAPDFALPNAIGLNISLHERLHLGPVVLMFYRGAWCPFCNATLEAYQEILPEIRSRDASLIAVNPQHPDDTLSLVQKLELEFDLLSDIDQQVIRAFDVEFSLPQPLREIYSRDFDTDLTEKNADGTWNLPVPATFVLDGKGIVRARHVSMDHSKRMEPTEILSALDAIAS